MNYKELKGYLIAIDLDNTILLDFDTIDKPSFEVLKEIAKNNYIVIATGRPWRSSRPYYNLLNLKTPIINYNGSYVHHPSDANFKEVMLTMDRFKLFKFYNDNKDILVNMFCEVKEEIYLMNKTDYIMPYIHAEGGNLHVGDIDQILDTDSNGAILFTKLGTEDKLRDYVNEKYKEVKIRYWFTNETVVSELYNPTVSKAKALEEIRQYYNVEKEKTIAIGDGHNDIEMLDWANIGVAMENSHHSLFKHANYVTKTVFESGVKYFFENYDFNKND